MHSLLYVCLPRSEARTSLQARKKVCRYLTEEGFDTELRFSGCCDYFTIGGSWSGQLSMMRLRYEHRKQFDRFSKRNAAGSKNKEESSRLFREMFPHFRGMLPIYRSDIGIYGAPDDAQIMDEPLFQQLKKGFTEEIKDDYENKKPTVIFTDDPNDDFFWPETNEEASEFWVVLVDYHE